MQLKMQQDNSSFIGFIVTFSIWGFSNVFAFIGLPTIAQFASLCVVISACWTIIANSGKAIDNIERFYEWYKQFKKK